LARDTAQAFQTELAATLAGRSDADTKYLFLGILQKHLPAGTQVVLVGGSLVELYTLGATTSMDLDLIGDRRVVWRFLKAAGFEEDGRYLVHPDWPLLLEMPGHDLRPSESTVTVEYEGYRFQAVTLEDCIVDRLLAAKFWRSRPDWEQAIILAEAGQGRIDWPALLGKADQNQAEDVAEELRRLVAGP
jgi:hypothetical protein